jgi:hypothetical protein
VNLAFAVTALAVDKPDQPGRFHAGPFWFTPKIELRSAGRNSNVYNEPFAATSDAAAVLSPRLEVALPVGQRSRFTSEGFLNLNWFHEQASERSTDRGFKVRGEVDVGPATFFGETGRGWYKQRFTIDLDERLPYRDKSATVGADLKLGRKVTVTGGLETQRFDIDDAGTAPGVAVALDRDTRTIRLEGRYALTRHTSAVASQEWIEDSFDEAIGAASADVQSRRFLAGFEFDSRGLLGRFLAGVRDFPAQAGSAAPSYSGPALVASLAFPATSRARVRLDAEREVYYAARPGLQPDGSLGRNSYVSWRSHGELAVELPFDLLARGLVGFEDASYRLPTQADGTLAADASSHRWTWGATLLRAFGRAFKLGGGITWEQRTGRAPTPPYHGTTWGLQAEFTP